MTAGTTSDSYKSRNIGGEERAMKNTDVTLNPTDSRPPGAYDRSYNRVRDIIEEMQAVTELIEKKVVIVTRNVPYADAEDAQTKSDRSPLESVSPMGDNFSTIFAGLVGVLEKLEAIASNIVS